MDIYNSNKIEGSTLTEERTASLSDNGTLPESDGYYRAKDVEKTVEHAMNLLLEWYGSQEMCISVLAEFHARYESIHPFQEVNVIQGDGDNGTEPQAEKGACR